MKKNTYTDSVIGEKTTKTDPELNGSPQAPANACLSTAFRYLSDRAERQLGDHLSGGVARGRAAFPPPVLQADATPFARFLAEYRPSPDELTAIMLAFAPHLQPGLFEQIIGKILPQGGELPELGGVKSGNHRGMVPTGETLLFVLAGARIEERLYYQQWIRESRLFKKDKILRIEAVRPGEPTYSGRLLPDSEWLEKILTGKVSLPVFSTDFPAQNITTELDWDDLILNPDTARQLRELDTWLRHHRTLLKDWGMGRKVKPGYRALFYGPPGTGKTLTASLLGKSNQKPVFRIDLSMVVSKYIGETEKNLSVLFDKAADKNWILFFDEADALFGKRTNVRDAHDKYANQETSYLLQRIEDFPGLVILASNFKSNIDDAFVRRFQSVVYFPMPGPEERRLLWQKTFPPAVQIENPQQLRQIAEEYELSGSNIVNIVQYCCLQALDKSTDTITHEDIQAGIQRELLKENKIA